MNFGRVLNRWGFVSFVTILVILLGLIGAGVFLFWQKFDTIVQTQEPEPLEIVELRGENSKTYDLGKTPDGRQKYSLDVSMGAVHYKDNYSDEQEQWKDIDLTWQGNKITKAPYELTLEGKQITVRDKKTGEVSTIELLDIRGKEVSIPTWSFSKGLAKAEEIAKDTDLEIVAESTRVRFSRVLKSDQAPSEARFAVAGNIPLQTYSQDQEDSLPVKAFLENGILTETFEKPDRPIKYVVRIDPTLDLQVGVGTDDGMYLQDAGTYFNNTGWNMNIGDQTGENYAAFYRLTGVSGLSGATIDVSYISQQKRTANGGSPLTKIRAERANAPAAPTTAADARGRTLTTAGVDWDSPVGATDTWINSPSLNTVFQEIANNHNPTVIQVFHLDDAGLDGATYNPWAYDGDTTKAPKLHIEYTAAAVTTIGGGADHTPPTRYNAQPTGTLSAGTTQTIISLTTDEPATCKYSTERFTPYYLMTNAFSVGGAISNLFPHSSLITGLRSGHTYNYYVKCLDAKGNVNPDDFLISFHIAEEPPVPTPEPSIAPSPTIFVTLASPSSGQAPLYGVDLIAIVSGTATGTINYIFYCDRSDAGTNITPDYSARYNSIAFVSQEADDACNYLSPGTYYPKVIVERGLSATEARAKITVTEKKEPEEVIPEKLITEMTVEEIKAKITKIQQEIIELIKQLIQLIQEQVIQLQT